MSRCSILLGVLVCWLSIVSPTSAETATPAPSNPVSGPECRYADTLLGSELFSAAAFWYLDLLQAHPGLPCAETGFIVATSAMTPEPEPDPSPTPTPNPFGGAIQLANQGYEDEAETAFIETLKENPQTTPTDEEKEIILQDWTDDSRLVAWLKENWLVSALQGNGAVRLLSTDVAPIGAELPSLATRFSSWALSLGGLLVTALLAYGLVQILRSGKVRTVDILPFNSDASGSSIGTALAEAIQASYRTIGTSDFAASIKLVTEAKAEGENEIPAELANGAAGVMSSLLKWARSVRSTTYVLSGTTVSDKTRGAGVVVCLARGNEIKDTEAVWFRDYFGTPPDSGNSEDPTVHCYLALADTVAAWLYAALAEPGRLKQSSERSDEPRYHTEWKTWDSYALFQNAVSVTRSGETEQAIALLHRSLSKDGAFLPARMNLGTLEVQNAALRPGITPAELASQFLKYQTLMESLWKYHDPNPKDPLLQPRLLFNLLAAIDYCTGWKPDLSCDESTRTLLAELQRTWTDAANSTDLKLRELAVPLKLMFYTMTIRFGSERERQETLQRQNEQLSSPIGAPDAFGYRNLYGYACLCAAAYFRPESTDKETWAERSLAYLRAVVDISPETKKWASVDPSLEPIRTSPAHKAAFEAIVREEVEPEPPPTRTEHVILFANERANRLVSSALQALANL